MDKIWYRNPSKSEVIGHCGGDEKKRMTTQNRQKTNAKKNPTFFRILSRLASELAWPEISCSVSACLKALMSVSLPSVRGSSGVNLYSRTPSMRSQ